MGRGRFTGIIASLMGLMAASVAAHHSFSAEVTREQTDQADRQGHRDAMVQPARVDLHQRDRQGRQGREVGLGDRRRQRTLPSRMAEEDLAAGTELVIDGYQARNGSTTANATSITFKDGRRLFAGSSNPNAPTK